MDTASKPRRRASRTQREELVQQQIWLTREQKRWLAQQALDTGMKMTELVRMLIDQARGAA